MHTLFVKYMTSLYIDYGIVLAFPNEFTDVFATISVTEHCPTLSETVSAKSKLNDVLDSAESTFVQIHYQIPTIRQ